MINNPSVCLVILAGGQSTRMGTDKAVIDFDGRRLIDILISRYPTIADPIILSARQAYDTGLPVISDDPEAPDGPVGAIFSVAARLQRHEPQIAGFVTVPVDAPYAPADLIERLCASGSCAVAQDQQRLHPTFAYWRCDIVNRIRDAYEPGERAPSLRWLADKTDAKTVTWSDEGLFLNINWPEDLVAAERRKKAGT
tara:strand:- start:16875 stop:17465 length:591 start_codon:yes stop_codon:yes gene_type:complete